MTKKIIANGIALSDLDAAVLDHVVLDWDAWVRDYVSGTIAKYKAQMDQEARAYIDNAQDIENVPASVDGRVSLYLGRNDVLNRVDRDARLPMNEGRKFNPDTRQFEPG